MNFEEIKLFCEDQSRLTEILVDNILLNYGAKNDGLYNKFKKKISNYKNIEDEMPDEWHGMSASQYMAYEIFKKEGLSYKYIYDQNVLRFSDSIEMYIKFQIKNPWKFSYCVPKDSPYPNFFNMVDVLNNEEFLLYSPGLEKLLEDDDNVCMHFYLISYNGVCWQTYGPHVYFRGLLDTDLMFFSKQINPDIMFGDQIYNLIDENPVPFMSLFYGGEVPLAYNKEHLVIENTSEYYEKDFNIENFKELFNVDEKYPLYKLSLKGFDGLPHFAKCYYHIKKYRLFLTAMTVEGYKKIIEAFNSIGYNLPQNPENRATLNIINLTEKILDRKIDLNPYAASFIDGEASDSEINKMNAFVELLIDAYNAKKDYDIREFANKADISLEMAYDLEKSIKKTFDRL